MPGGPKLHRNENFVFLYSSMSALLSTTQHPVNTFILNIADEKIIASDWRSYFTRWGESTQNQIAKNDDVYILRPRFMLFALLFNSSFVEVFHNILYICVFEFRVQKYF